MTVLAAFTPHTGARLAEVGFLLILIAGALLFFAQLPLFRQLRTSLAGLLLVAAGVLLIVATHWAYFGVR